MEGGALIPPQVVAVEEGHLEMLKQSHIKVDSRYFSIDPNLDFESSTILCEDRVYVSDQTPSATAPITFTIQPQFNVFRSLSESRFVFTLRAVIPESIVGGIVLLPKAYWSQLFVRDFTININNVACNDQHSRTAMYAGFMKILLTQGDLKTTQHSTIINNIAGASTTSITNTIYSWAGDDTRTLQEGIMNLDCFQGQDFQASYNNVVMTLIGGTGGGFGNAALHAFQYPTGFNIAIELTYRPQDGIFLQPKLLPPGVNLNYIFNTNTIGTWCNGYYKVVPNALVAPSFNPDSAGCTYTIVKAQYYERQYTATQTAIRAYQSLIMRQPLYYSCMTSNTLLYPVASNAQSVQLTNVFSGRLPNIIVVALLNQAPTWRGQTATSANSNLLTTYSPLASADLAILFGGALAPLDCISNVQLTVNGRTYPHLWTSNMAPGSTADLSQWYEQYRQCSLITALNGRDTDQPNTNFDVKYKYDNPVLSKAEFNSQATFCCFNIRRNGTVLNCSGDKEVGGIDLLVNINGTSHPSAQLLVVGLSTDSLATITDGGATTSFVF
jgi:hypothetical protein